MIVVGGAGASTVSLSSEERQSIIVILQERAKVRQGRYEGEEGETNVISFFGSELGNTSLRIRLIR